MTKLKLHTPNLVAENIGKLAALFPGCVTEAKDEATGQLKRAIDFDQLRQELSDHIVDGPRERYHLDWPGKREALLAANAPIAKTLRPCREESVDFDTTKNLFIEGDNLDALKLLQETYLGKVKLIYIDPPYNTGNDFLYADDLSADISGYLLRTDQKDGSGQRLVANQESNGRFHSDWLSMMLPRLKLARNLLRDDGSVFISIDDNELQNLLSLCDQVFGASNFVGVFVWEKRTTRENRKVVSVSHDYVVCFAREKSIFESVRGLLPRTEENESRFENLDDDPRGPWQSVSINAQAGPGRRKEQFYTIVTPSGRRVDPPSGRCWLYTEPRLFELIADGRIWFGQDGNNVPRLKCFRSESNDGVTPHTLWQASEVGTTDTAKKAIKEQFDGVEVFDTPKPVGLLQRVLQVGGGCESGDLFVDFFAGSGTLAEACFLENLRDGKDRCFLLVQMPEGAAPDSGAFKAGYKTIADVAKERVRRAAKHLLERHGGVVPKLDTGFRVLSIDTSNLKDVYHFPQRVRQEDLLGQSDNLKEDRAPEDLLFQVLVDWGVDLRLSIEHQKLMGSNVFFVDGNALVACFDRDISDDLVKELARRRPLRAVFRDSSYANDSTKINVEQIFKLLSPETEVRTL